MKHIVVIGSGFGGLAAAIRLQHRGYAVTLVEQRDQPGGRAYVYRQDGFTFDGGPTVITAPWLLHELFELTEVRSQDYISLVPVDPFYRIFFADGESFDYSGDQTQMLEAIHKLSPHESDAAGYLRFVGQTEKIFEKGFEELASVSFDKFTDMLRIVPDLIRLGSYRSVYSYVSTFVRDERLRMVLSFHPLLVGGNPFQTTSIYTLIHELERKWGVWFAQGGTGAIVDALAKRFEEIGGVLRLSTEVTTIVTRNGVATGVELADGSRLDADAVVCNAEVARAYERLIPERDRRKNTDARLAQFRYSMSLVVIYFGTDRAYRSTITSRLAHHNIILGSRYKGLLTDIFERKILPDDFSLYLHMPTATDPSLAPPGCDAFYVLAPVPHLGGVTNWEEAAQPYRDRIIKFLEERYLPELSDHIVTEHMIDPRHFDSVLSSYLGSAFSVEPVLTQSAWFRPHNRSEDIDHLYFVGAGTHPGAGLPGVLTSAKIAEQLVLEDLPMD